MAAQRPLILDCQLSSGFGLECKPYTSKYLYKCIVCMTLYSMVAQEGPVVDASPQHPHGLISIESTTVRVDTALRRWLLLV